MNRNTTNFYAQEATIDIQRSKTKRAMDHKTTFNTGYLIPFYVDTDIMPGVTIKNTTKVLCRMATPIYPVMDNAYLDTYYFKVPHWTVWDGWKQFNGENENGAWANTTELTVPMYQTTTTPVANGDLADYFGIPTGITNLSFQQLAFRAYFRIYNFWFRDQNLIAPIQYDKGNENVAYESMAGGNKPLKAAKFFDYFTAALPAPQKAQSPVTLPIGTTAPVVGNNTTIGLTSGEGLNAGMVAGTTSGGHWLSESSNKYGGTLGDNTAWEHVLNGGVGLTTDATKSGMIADLTTAVGATINAIRLAFATQRVYEKNARYGTRYNEIIRGIWGVNSPNASLHVPEYLGGKRIPINVNTIVQNSSSVSDSPLGETGGMSVTFDANVDFTKSFDEHSIILGIAVVRTDHTYQNGLPRMFTRTRLFDYYQPSFAHLGNQPIYNYEIYAQGTEADNEVFGYKEAWSEYRQLKSQVTAEFRSSYEQSLDAWHYADDFQSLPVLAQTFIEETDTNVARTIAIENQAQWIADFYIEQDYAAPMPVHCEPGLVDHF